MVKLRQSIGVSNYYVQKDLPRRLIVQTVSGEERGVPMRKFLILEVPRPPGDKDYPLNSLPPNTLRG